MSRDLQIAFEGPVTATYAALPEGMVVGQRRFENGKQYELQQADDAITVNQAVMPDSATGVKVTPTAAATDGCVGVAETAIADEYYGWITTAGNIVQALVADGTAAGDILAPSGTAGVLAIAPTSTARRHVRAIALEANSSGGALAKAVRLL